MHSPRPAGRSEDPLPFVGFAAAGRALGVKIRREAECAALVPHEPGETGFAEGAATSAQDDGSPRLRRSCASKGPPAGARWPIRPQPGRHPEFKAGPDAKRCASVSLMDRVLDWRERG